MKCVNFFLLFLLWVILMTAELDARGRNATSCKRSYHAHLPMDGQIFYMFNPQKAEWLYPAHDYWIKTHPHKPRTIMDVVWPKWKWLTCRDGYVAVESMRYPHYYLSGWKGYSPFIQYTHFPCRENWSQWNPIENKTDYPPISDLSIDFIPRFVNESDHSYGGMQALIHIPPVCEKVTLVRVMCNLSPTSMMTDDISFNFEAGIMNSVKRSRMLEVTSEVMAAVKGAVSVSRRISAMWAKEISHSMHEKYTLVYKTRVMPMSMVKIRQNEVSYGSYRIKSEVLTKLESRADPKKCGTKLRSGSMKTRGLSATAKDEMARAPLYDE